MRDTGSGGSARGGSEGVVGAKGGGGVDRGGDSVEGLRRDGDGRVLVWGGEGRRAKRGRGGERDSRVDGRGGLGSRSTSREEEREWGGGVGVGTTHREPVGNPNPRWRRARPTTGETILRENPKEPKVLGGVPVSG